MRDTAQRSLPLDSRKSPELKSRSAAALRAASDMASTKLKQALRDFESLKDPAIRAAYGDRFLKLWASDFEFVWPMLYEILAQFEKDELFKQEQRAGGVYGSFQEYFEDRLKVPFERWASLEQTYQYVSKYAPGMFAKTFSEARAMSRAEKRAAIEVELRRDPGQTDRQIARKLSVHNNTVKIVREELEACDQIDHVATRIDTKGRVQPTRKATAKPRKKRTPYEQAAWLIQNKLSPPELRKLMKEIEKCLST